MGWGSSRCEPAAGASELKLCYKQCNNDWCLVPCPAGCHTCPTYLARARLPLLLHSLLSIRSVKHPWCAWMKIRDKHFQFILVGDGGARSSDARCARVTSAVCSSRCTKGAIYWQTFLFSRFGSRFCRQCTRASERERGSERARFLEVIPDDLHSVPWQRYNSIVRRCP